MLVGNGSRLVLVGALAVARTVTLASAPGDHARVTIACEEYLGTEAVSVETPGAPLAFHPGGATSIVLAVNESLTLVFEPELDVYVIEGRYSP